MCFNAATLLPPHFHSNLLDSSVFAQNSLADHKIPTQSFCVSAEW